MLDRLPPEIIDQVLCHLTPIEVARVMPTCRFLRDNASRDSVWQRFVQARLGMTLNTPAPYQSWSELYKSHHPHLFLAKYKLWYSDLQDYGRLLVARYDPRRGYVEAYQVQAKSTGPQSIRILNWGSAEFVTRTFHPLVFLELNSPVVRLSPEEYKTADQQFGREPFLGGSKMRPAVQMNVRNRAMAMERFMTEFLHTRDLPPSLCDSQTEMWPPLALPSPNNKHTRRVSTSSFRSSGHTPPTAEDVSETSFRIRTKLLFHSLIPSFVTNLGHPTRFPGEETETFATIPESAYTPTREKPWQGIWVGDYSSHGCEFLLLTQPDPREARPLPEKCKSAFANWPRSTPWQALIPDSVPDVDEMGTASAEGDEVGAFPPVTPTNLTAALQARHRRESVGEVPPVRTTASSPLIDPTDEYPYKGRLEALKLTGDPNVPRGEITFVAEDLGSRGLVGYTKDRCFVDPALESRIFPATGSSTEPLDETWRGSRMVRCCGHVADTSPRRDSYIPTQLVLISPEVLALWWIPYRYVVFYHRVNVDHFMKC